MSSVTHFSSSAFVVSQSVAKFINGVSVTGSVAVDGILNGTFIGDGSELTSGDGGISLFAGLSDGGTPPTFTEPVVSNNSSVLLTASSSNGYLNHYTFIVNDNGEWRVVSSGSNNGLEEQNTYQTPVLETGVYRYLVYGHSSASNATVVKGTTITVEE